MKTKTRLLFILTLLIISSVSPFPVFAQYPAHTQLNLPEGAKARLGRGVVEDLQFSPDNKLLAVVTSIGVWIHDITTGEDLALLTEQNTGAYTSVAFSPDGSMLASGHSDSAIQLWNVDNFTLIRTLPTFASNISATAEDGVTSVAFNSDGTTLASGGVDNTVRLWDVNTGRQKKNLGEILGGHTDVVTSVAFGPDPNAVDPRCPEEILASASRDTTVILWDLSTGQPKQTFTGHTDIITKVAISPNPMIPVLASSSRDGTIQMWDLSKGELKHTLTNERGLPIDNICFKSDGYILMSSDWLSVNLWATLSGAHKQQLEGSFACFSPDGSLIATSNHMPQYDYYNSGGYKYGVRILAMHPAQIWGTEEGLVFDNPSFAPAFVLSRDGKTTAVVDAIDPPNDAKHRRHFEFYIYDTTQRSEAYPPPLTKPKTIISTADWAVVPDFCFASDAKIVPDSDYWSASDFVAFEKANPDINTVCDVKILDAGLVDYALSPDGQTLAVLLDRKVAKSDQRGNFQVIRDDWFRSVLLFDTATGELESLYELAHDHYLRYGHVFSPDGLTLAYVASGWDHNVEADITNIVLKDVRSGSTRQSIRVPTWNTYIGFSPDSKTILSANRDDTSIRMWDVSSGSLKQTLSGSGTGAVIDIAYSPDGKTIAISRQDIINWWDVETGKHLFRKNRVGSRIAFSRDSKTVWEYHYPLTTLWNVCTGEEIQFGAQNIVRHSEYSKDYSEYHDPHHRVELLPDDEEGLTLQTDQYLSGFGGIGLYDLSGVADTGLVFTGYEKDARSINQVSFSADGKILASAGGYLRLWDVETATLKTDHTLLNHLPAYNAVFNQSAVIQALASSTWNQISVSSPPYNKIDAHLTGHTEHITSLAFSPLGSSTALASGSYDKTVKVWYYVTHGDQSEASWTLSGHTGAVMSVAFGKPRGENYNILASGSLDKTIRLWYPADPFVLRASEESPFKKKPMDSVTLTGHTLGVTSLVFGPEYSEAFGPKYSGTSTLVSGSFDSTIRLWAVKVGELNGELNKEAVSLKHILTGHGGPVTSVAFNQWGTLVASGGMDKTIRIWNPFLGKHLKTLRGHKGAVNSVSFSPDGKTLASGSADGTILLWDINFPLIVIDIRADVNEDGTIDIQDLVQVSENLGETGENPEDVNGDGVVNSIDLTLVAAAFGEEATAPATRTVVLENFTATEVAQWIQDTHKADLLNQFDSAFQRGVEVLKDLLTLFVDVNRDGTVNIQDLVLVASNFGETGENPEDVNGDGVVNIIDLTLVAGAFGETAAAPAAHATIVENLTATEVAQWLQAAQNANLTDPVFQRGIEVLKNLLTLLVPKETVLLANYPNPFNPETWIPYQLANPAEVTLRIYAIDGSLVRTLSLGHKPIGIYQTRTRAAYWDGRNQIGEPVASGVYFYTFTASDFTATRKMLIRK